MVSPQSSRRAALANKEIFSSMNTANLSTPSYFVEKTFTQNGETDLRLKKKEQAQAWHYIVGVGILVGAIYYASKKLD